MDEPIEESQERGFPNQHPDYPDKSSFELYILEGPFKNSFRCQCWKSDRSRQCGNPATTGFEVCEDHGAAAGKANTTHGQSNKVLMKTRKEFLARMRGNDGAVAGRLVDKLHEIAENGNLEAIKYVLDQLYGTARSTQVTEIVNRDLLARTIKVTAKHLKREAFTAWLFDLKIEMGDDLDLDEASGSTN